MAVALGRKTWQRAPSLLQCSATFFAARENGNQKAKNQRERKSGIKIRFSENLQKVESSSSEIQRTKFV